MRHFDVWLQQGYYPRWGARLLRDGQGRSVLPQCWHSKPAQHSFDRLWVQCLWASVLCLSGTYGQLLDFLVFAVLMFYILTVVGLLVLRIRRPDMERPYRVFGYSVVPGLYLLLASFIEVQLLRYKPQYTWPGLMIILLGVPVHWFWQKSQSVILLRNSEEQR